MTYINTLMSFPRLTSELNVACVSPLADNHTVVRPFEFESTRLRVFMLLAKVQDLPQRQPSEVPPPPHPHLSLTWSFWSLQKPFWARCVFLIALPDASLNRRHAQTCRFTP